jgi:hypothetical protein
MQGFRKFRLARGCAMPLGLPSTLRDARATVEAIAADGFDLDAACVAKIGMDLGVEGAAARSDVLDPPVHGGRLIGEGTFDACGTARVRVVDQLVSAGRTEILEQRIPAEVVRHVDVSVVVEVDENGLESADPWTMRSMRWNGPSRLRNDTLGSRRSLAR